MHAPSDLANPARSPLQVPGHTNAALGSVALTTSTPEIVIIGRMDEGMRPTVGYLLALLVGTIVVAAVPWISIGLLG